MSHRFGWSAWTVVLSLICLMTALPTVAEPGRAAGDRVMMATKTAFPQTGDASYYNRNLSGKRTASGEKYIPGKLTAAHRTLPFGTWVKVTDLENGKSVIVRINDRGPHSAKRIIDLSESAAKIIGLVRKGIAKVRIEVTKRR